MSTNDDEVLVLLRACDAITFHYLLPDGQACSIFYDGAGGNLGLPQPVVGLRRDEALALFRNGIARRYSSREEHEAYIKQIQQDREQPHGEKH